MARRRVVVTGMGMLTCLGNSVASTWEGLCAGRSGIRNITHFDTSGFATQFAGVLQDFSSDAWLPAKEARRMDDFMVYGLVAGLQAWADSGLAVGAADGERYGVCMGSGIGGISGIEAGHQTLLSEGPRRISPFFVAGQVINMIAGNLAIRLGLQGPNLALTTACTTGTHSIGLAARCIAYGDADVMLAGGAEKASTPLGIAGFNACRALSVRNDDPTAASRPFDRDRDGFVLADGAGALVLEDYEHARARGARIYAELIGFGMSDDAFHVTSPPEDGRGAAQAMRHALRDAGLSPDAVDYINAHGTSTSAGDLAESRAIETVFADAAVRTPVSSTKSMTGHLLGAAGAVEAIISILTIQHGVIPPTINLDHVDPDCRLDYVPHQARQADVRVVLSNSFGFGGTNGSLVFARVP